MKSDTYIIVPAYNEQKTISHVIRKIKKHSNNIIVVDDGSKDKTQEVSEKEKVTVLRHIVNLGKGAALKTGCEYAFRKGAQNVVVIDADGQHDPDDIPRFLKNLKTVDIVFGSRTLNKRMPFVLKFGNWFINETNRLLFGIDLQDTQSGFRAFTKRAYQNIRWEAQDYSVESEMVANTGRRKLRYAEIKIKTIYSDKYKGTTVLDGIKIVMNMIWWRITRWH